MLTKVILPFIVLYAQVQVCLTIDDEKTRKMYAEFRKLHPRHNMTKQEEEDRFANFQETLERVGFYNQETNSSSFGITKFADWYEDELEQFLAPLKAGLDVRFRGPDQALFKHFREKSSKPIPPYFSWEHVASTSRVRDQLQDRGEACNSCWANTISVLTEIVYRIRTGRVIHLADDELVDCDNTNSGCRSGSTRRALLRGHKTGYKLQEKYVKHQCPNQWDVKVNRLYSFTPKAVTDMMRYLAYNGPIAVNMAWPASLFYYRDFRIFLAQECRKARAFVPQHAVLLVGYGEENGIKYWILRNSYGPDWGRRGYFRLERGADACRVESYAATADLKEN